MHYILSHNKFFKVFWKSCNARYHKMILCSAPTGQFLFIAKWRRKKQAKPSLYDVSNIDVIKIVIFPNEKDIIKHINIKLKKSFLSGILTRAGKMWGSKKISCIKIEFDHKISCMLSLLQYSVWNVWNQHWNIYEGIFTMPNDREIETISP